MEEVAEAAATMEVVVPAFREALVLPRQAAGMAVMTSSVQQLTL